MKTAKENYKNIDSHQKNKIQEKKFRKNTNTVFRNEMSYDLVQKIQTSISKLRKQNYSTRSIADQLSLKTSQIYYIEQQINEQLEKSMYFNLNRRHKKCISQADSTDLLQSSSIYRKFLEKFVKSRQSISLKSFQIILKKHCKATYKLKKNRLSFGIQACEDKYQYSLKYLSLSSSNQKFIYLDETTLGHQQKQYTFWQITDDNIKLFYKEIKEQGYQGLQDLMDSWLISIQSVILIPYFIFNTYMI